MDWQLTLLLNKKKESITFKGMSEIHAHKATKKLLEGMKEKGKYAKKVSLLPKEDDHDHNETGTRRN